MPTPAPPHPACALSHHLPGRQVTYTKGLVVHFGTVVDHDGDRRMIRIRRPDNTIAFMPCGPVAKC